MTITSMYGNQLFPTQVPETVRPQSKPWLYTLKEVTLSETQFLHLQNGAHTSKGWLLRGRKETM